MKHLLILMAVLVVIVGCGKATTSDDQTDKARALDKIVQQSPDADKIER